MSAQWSISGAHPVRAALDVVTDAYAEVADASLWSLADGEIGRLVELAAQAVAQAQSVLVRLVGEADSREVPRAAGAPNSTQWLRARARLTPAEASTYVKTATQTRTGLPATAAALAAGIVNLGQVAAIGKAITDLGSDIPAGAAEAAETLLLDAAGTDDAVMLSRLGARIGAVVDPDGQDARDGEALARYEARALRRRFFDIPGDGEGGSWLRGRLGAEAAEMLRAALEPFMAPRSASADGPDRRTVSQRRADALTELARRALNTGELPIVGGERPHVSVTIPLSVLQSGVGTATLPGGTPLSATDARRLACDCNVIPLVLGAKGAPLDVGRSRRFFTGALRKAVVARDHGCSFPGCDRPASWCDVHHIKHWALGGTTCLSNGVLLCGFHHNLVEHSDWEVFLDQLDQLPSFRPPSWIDPDRRPLRNRMHQRPD